MEQNIKLDILMQLVKFAFKSMISHASFTNQYYLLTKLVQAGTKKCSLIFIHYEVNLPLKGIQLSPPE